MSEARDKVDEWVAAGLGLQRGARPSAALIDRVRPFVEATLEILAVLPPVGVIADLARLLTREDFDIAESEPVADPELRAALDAYEEHVLGRLAADLRLEHARDALLRLELGLRPAATAVFVEQVLARLHAARAELGFDTPGPVAIRRVLHRHGLDLLELGAEVLAEPELEPLRRELSASYLGLARAARQSGGLIGDVELYTLENHAALRSPSLRLAMAQIAEAAQAIERVLPVRVRRSEASRGRTPTRIEDESAYPIGGYASISTSGGIESLVSSELIYMSSAQERASSAQVDLFDLRWAGGELLKYTRDESVHTRERRTICFVLMPALDHARIKDPQVPFQRIVVAFGAVIAGVRKLCAWLDEAELSLVLITVAELPRAGRASTQPLQPEAALTRLLLREYIESGVVELRELEDADEARLHAQEAAELGASDLVWLLGSRWQPSEPDQGAGAGALLGPAYREHALSLDEATPRLWTDTGTGTEARPLREQDWEAWLEAVSELLQALV